MIGPIIRFDIDRDERIGLAEAVFCAGKSLEAVTSLVTRFSQPTEKPVLFTRLDSTVFAQLPLPLQQGLNYDPLSRTAWHHTYAPYPRGTVAVVSAGTADGFVTHEVLRTLQYMGWTGRAFEDCGVAGLWRIQQALPEINRCDVVIAVAGLDAALISVLGGLTDRPLFAVPTSVGYGVAQHGMTALSSMLASCAPGVAVLNIDNGYGAACAAGRVLRAMGLDRPAPTQG